MSGISQPLMKAPLAGTPQQSAQKYTADQANSQANLAKAVGGKRIKSKNRYKGGDGGLPAPQMLTPYPVAGAGDQNPNAIMLKNASSQNQGGANAVYDNAARMKGGRRRRRSTLKKSKRRRKICSRRRTRKSRRL